MKKFFLFWFLAGVCEGPFIQAVVLGDTTLLEQHPFFSISLHLLGILCLFSAVRKTKSWFSPDTLWVGPFLIFAGFLPFFGWILGGGIYFIYYFSEREIKLEAREGHFSEHLMKQVFIHNSKNSKQRIAEELDFMSLIDILHSGDVSLVRSAVEKLASLQTPESVEVLQKERSNQNPEIRFYVTSALTRLKKDFDEELEAAKENMRKDVYKVSARNLLAKVYFQYANSNLLDEDTRKNYIQESLYHIDFVCQSEYASPRAFWLKYEIEKGQALYQNAFETLKYLFVHDSENEEQILYKQAKLYFKMKQWDEFKKSLKNISLGEAFSRKEKSTLQWWGIS